MQKKTNAKNSIIYKNLFLTISRNVLYAMLNIKALGYSYIWIRFKTVYILKTKIYGQENPYFHLWSWVYPYSLFIQVLLGQTEVRCDEHI